MEQSPSLEAISRSARQRIPYVLWKPKVHYSPTSCLTFCNMLILYCERLLASRLTPKLEDHPLSAIRYYLFSIFAAAFHI